MVFVFNGWDHNGLIRQDNKGMEAIEQTMKYKRGNPALGSDRNKIKNSRNQG